MKRNQRQAEIEKPFVPKLFPLVPSETILPDDYPLVVGYVYITVIEATRGAFSRFEGSDFVLTVGDWKKLRQFLEVRRCSLFAHEGARIGDEIEITPTTASTP